MDMTGKVVLITGASRGIGAASAREFAAAGAKVALVARSGNEIEALAAEIGEAATAICCDVASYEDVMATVASATKTLGPIEVLINNAGLIDPIGHLQDTDVAAWSKTIDVNLKGVFNGMHAVVPSMMSGNGGTIINISSGAAHHAIEGWSAYCSSKAGVYMLTRCADNELRDQGIRVLGLSPGTVATDMQREIKASGINAVSKLDWSDHIPPEWVAKTLVWMCGAGADPYLGTDVSLREDDIRKKVGLI